ncbi:MAG: hypothetical protein ABIS01_16960 [Ferruginibacter sp.]
MEPENLKDSWKSITGQTAKKDNLTPEIINQLTHKKYNAMIKKVKYPEWIGGAVCLLGAAFISFNFGRLDTMFLKVVGITSILILISTPIISVISVGRFNLVNDLGKPYAATLRQFATQKLRFQKLQQVNAFINYLLLVTIIILIPKFSRGADVSTSNYFWLFAFSFGYIFLAFFSKWVKKYYHKSITQAEELLNELDC